MNPHSSKSRRLGQMGGTTTSNVGGVGGVIDGTKTPFQLSMDKQNNLIPRMGPSAIKHELYFPQCYAPPFNQAFGAQQQTHSSVVGTSSNNSTVGNASTTTPVPPTISAPTVAQWHSHYAFGFREYIKGATASTIPNTNEFVR